MQGKFAHILRNHRHHTRVVWTRRHLAKNHIIALNKHLHAENAVAAKGIRHLLGNFLRFSNCHSRHRLRLPRVAVVAILLNMANRLAKLRACHIANREQRNFVVKIHKALHNHTTRTGATAFLRNSPSALHIGFRFHHTLSVARRTHNGLHHTRNTHLVHRFQKFLLRGSKAISRSGNTQGFCRQAANPLAIHRQQSGISSGRNVVALLLQFHQSGRGNSLHLRDNMVGLARLNRTTKRLTIQHIQRHTTLRHLHSRSALIAVARHHFHT